MEPPFHPSGRALRRVARLLAASTTLAALALACNPAAAQNVLFLHTDEPGHDDVNVTAYSNLKSEFQAAGATVTDVGGLQTANSVSASTFTASGGGAYDLVIMASAYVAVDASNWAPINAAIAGRNANAFIMFNDGCCVPGNITAMGSAITATGAFTPSSGTTAHVLISAPLNTNSPYATSFTALNPLAGNDTTYYNNVPANNALYLGNGSSIPSAGTAPVNNVYGLFVPTAQSYGGAGACLFAVTDVSVFIQGYTSNEGKLGPAFLNATKAGGACGLPADIQKAFSPTTVASGGASTLTITVTNPTGAPVTGLKVIDALPIPLVVGAGSAATTTCTGGTLAAAVGGNSISLTNATLPAGGCTITVPVQWPAASAALCTGAGTTVTNTITPGSDFTTSLGQVNTPATATLSCLGAPNLSIAKSAPTPALELGVASTYTLTVTNTGTGAAAGATVAESLPAGLQLQTASGTNWTCSGTAPVSCAYSAAIAPGAAAAPLLIKALVQPSAADTTVTNYASVDPTAGTAPPTPGAACAPAAACAQRTDPVLTPRLTIAKSAPSPDLRVGQVSTYTITVTNIGTAGTAGATVQDALPPGLALVSATGSNWSCNSATPVVCTYGAALAPQAVAAPLLVKVIAQPGSLDHAVINYASVDPLGGKTPPVAGSACAPSYACAASPAGPVGAPFPVPTLSELALAALGLLMGALGWRQRQALARR